MKRAAILLAVTALAVVLVYLSRFWFLDLWPRSGLFGIAELRPGGGLLARWLRGTPFAPFELLIWVCGGFLVLTLVQRVVDRFNPPPAPEEDKDD
ncbi:hypothetical protein [Pseudaestuariivita atlantica]|uniref:Uncharacterized protein n=1 Tax=Pseudaestuariivita atlantica TaxID=1317121 RepID=A0A0L1JR17_9RHOB|nr:hypothetical protein [Pseudaestuariivita atlantica]KNG94234.1 hypothetical protein ATO11_08430 [Pseudaestuariivita atlantica]